MTASIGYSDVAVGDEVKPWTYKVERISLVMYAGASGDFNFIHFNEQFAKMVGLPNVIAHGMQTMARVGEYVTTWCGDPGAVLKFKTRFTSPVVVANEAPTEVSVTGKIVEKLDGNAVRLELSAAVGELNVAAAEAVVRLA